MTEQNQNQLDAQAAIRAAERSIENAEIAAKEVTPELQVTLDEAKAMIAKLRDFGLFYTIESDSRADRKPCLCGCGKFPAGKKSVYLPGHDARHHAAIAGTTRKGKLCACGCGNTTKGGTWMPGHDAIHASHMKKGIDIIAMCNKIA